MTRRIVYEFEGRKYSVNGDEILDVIGRKRHCGSILDVEHRTAMLGLMYMRKLSWQTGGVGDIPLLDDSDSSTGEKLILLHPALKTLANFVSGTRIGSAVKFK